MMRTNKFNIFRIITKTTHFLLIGLFVIAIGQTAGRTASAQERGPARGSGKISISKEAVKESKESRYSTYACQQKINDLTIVQHPADRYEFLFRTPCATHVTIEFSDQPPVSLSPPRFKKGVYDPNKALVPTITTGLIGERTEHNLQAHLGPDKEVDYYIITVQDALGNKVYKAGSLVLDSVRPDRVRAKIRRY